MFACPWLEQVDLRSCRGIVIENRRTLLDSLRKELGEYLAEARKTGTVLETVSGVWYRLEHFQSEGEEREGLMQVSTADIN